MHRVTKPVLKPASFGAILGLMILNLGVLLGGGGHGWLAPFSIGMLGVVTCPLTGLAWSMRHGKGKWLAALLLLVGLWTDYLFIQSLGRDNELQKAIQGSWNTILFLLLWGGWQIWAIITLLLKKSVKHA